MSAPSYASSPRRTTTRRGARRSHALRATRRASVRRPPGSDELCDRVGDENGRSSAGERSRGAPRCPSGARRTRSTPKDPTPRSTNPVEPQRIRTSRPAPPRTPKAGVGSSILPGGTPRLRKRRASPPLLRGLRCADRPPSEGGQAHLGPAPPPSRPGPPGSGPPSHACASGPSGPAGRRGSRGVP